MRVNLTWVSGPKCVQYQWATNSAFTKNVKTMIFNNPSRASSVPDDFGRTLPSLRNNTKYFIRARLINAAGGVGPWSNLITGVTNARTPEPINVKAGKVSNGRVKLSWVHNTQFTTSFRVHIASTPFTGGKKGKNHTVISLPVTAKSVVLTKKQLAALGTPIGSGRSFRYRVEARNVGASETRSRYSHTSTVAVAGQPNTKPKKPKTSLRIGTFNVASVKASGRNPSWSSRRSTVAKYIVNSKAGIIGLQEASTNKAGRSTQLKQLLAEVKSAQKKKKKSVKWKLVRSTRYIKPGQPGGDDGARILYDSARYKLLSKCSDTTGKGKKKRSYSTSCTVKLPRLGGVNYQRSAAVAQFQDRKTKQKFWVVSAHLEHRKGSKYHKNRKAQVDTILKHMRKVNKKSLPVFFVGDLNSSSARSSDFSIVNRLFKAGYFDGATAEKSSGLKYSTFNGWKKQKAASSGVAGRIDFVFANSKNVYATKYTNKFHGQKATDHNLVYVDFVMR